MDGTIAPDFAVVKFASGLPAGRVSCALSSRHGRRTHPDPSVEEGIERAWRRRLEGNPRLFNGCKFRLGAMRSLPGSGGGDADAGGAAASADGPALALDLGLTDYRSHLGTNASDASDRLVEDGWKIHGDGEAFLSMKLGVGALTSTSDGFLVFLLRSSNVAEAQGMVDVPGGHPEPERVGLPDVDSLSRREAEGGIDDKLCERAVGEIFDSAMDEVVAETNAPRESLGRVLLLGAVRQLLTAGTPSFAFGVRCALTRSELEERYALGAAEADESVRLVFARGASLLEKIRRPPAAGAGATGSAAISMEDCARAALRFERDEVTPLRFAPATRGCLTLWAAHAVGAEG